MFFLGTFNKVIMTNYEILILKKIIILISGFTFKSFLRTFRFWIISQIVFFCYINNPLNNNNYFSFILVYLQKRRNEFPVKYGLLSSKLIKKYFLLLFLKKF